MADRIYGPIRGAGTQVREKQPERNILPGQLGSTVMVGVFERGEEGGLIICPTKEALVRRTGGILDPADYNAAGFASLEAPMACRHFFDHSDGAGVINCIRVVPTTSTVSNDDRPDSAVMNVFNRENTPRLIGTITALNGGSWAGKRDYYMGEISGVPGVDFPVASRLQLAGVIPITAMKRDSWKGATCNIHGLTGTYIVVSNTSTGLLTFAADTNLTADWAAAGPPTDLFVTLERDNQNYRGQEKSMTVEFRNGALDPTGRFGVTVSVDGVMMLNYDDLSMDTTSPYYWLDVINTDPNNDLIVVADTFTGNRTAASARPANYTGLSDAVTATVLTINDPYIYSVSSPVGAWVPTLTWTSWGASVVPQLLTITLTDVAPPVTDLFLTTSLGNRVHQSTIGVALPPPGDIDPYIGSFIINAGAGVPTTGDIITIYLRPLYVDELIGGKINPNTVPTPNDELIYDIVSNTRTTVTVSNSVDLTDGGNNTGGENFLLEWPERLSYGYDGYIAGMVTADYEAVLDTATSELLRLKTMNQGLVKLSIPGIAKPSEAVVLQQKARTLCEAYNWMYRVEIPDEYVDELLALQWVNDTMGRLDLTCTFFPSFMYIRDPYSDAGSDARELLVSVTGMQLGREAKTAVVWGGYHKAAAGTEVTLPLVLRAPVIGRPDRPVRLNEEMLNPAGINCYRWATGGSTVIAWGDRTLDSTTVYRWKHKREQLSHYENVLIENFDWAIFQINDPEADADVLASLHSYFLEEYRKRAIRGTSFIGGRNPAAIIKMDAENNTDATRAQGNQNVGISLRFADTVERLNILIGAMGITESR